MYFPKKRSNRISKIIDCFIVVCIALLLALIPDRLFIIGKYGWDDLEHLASSWFIFNGYVPYRDFFQHHHPLLWYIQAPIFYFVEHPIDAFQVGRIMALIFFFGGLFLIGKIVKALGGGGRSFLYALLVYLSYPVAAGNYIQNRPDTYMIFFLLAGFYYWIKFWQSKKTTNIVWCYLLFFISFAFLQKAVWFLAPFGIYQIYLLCRKEIPWTSVLKAAGLPMVISVGYGGYLWGTDSLARYFELNWILNAIWFRSYRTYQYDVLDIIYALMTVMFLIYGCIKGRGVVRHLSFVCTCVALIFLFTPKPYFFYWLVWTPMASIYIGLSLEKLYTHPLFLVRFFERAFWLFTCFLVIVYILLGASWVTDASDFEKKVKDVSGKMEQGDILVDYGDMYGHFFRTFPEHYYWYSLCRGALYDSRLFHRHTLPNWDKVIYEQKPKYIYYHRVYDLTTCDDNNTDHQIMGILHKNWVDQNYNYIEDLEIYERKKDKIK